MLVYPSDFSCSADSTLQLNSLSNPAQQSEKEIARDQAQDSNSNSTTSTTTTTTTTTITTTTNLNHIPLSSPSPSLSSASFHSFSNEVTSPNSSSLTPTPSPVAESRAVGQPIRMRHIVETTGDRGSGLDDGSWERQGKRSCDYPANGAREEEDEMEELEERGERSRFNVVGGQDQAQEQNQHSPLSSPSTTPIQHSNQPLHPPLPSLRSLVHSGDIHLESDIIHHPSQNLSRTGPGPTPTPFSTPFSGQRRGSSKPRHQSSSTSTSPPLLLPPNLPSARALDNPAFLLPRLDSLNPFNSDSRSSMSPLSTRASSRRTDPPSTSLPSTSDAEISNSISRRGPGRPVHMEAPSKLSNRSPISHRSSSDQPPHSPIEPQATIIINPLPSPEIGSLPRARMTRSRPPNPSSHQPSHQRDRSDVLLSFASPRGPTESTSRPASLDGFPTSLSLMSSQIQEDQGLEQEAGGSNDGQEDWSSSVPVPGSSGGFKLDAGRKPSDSHLLSQNASASLPSSSANRPTFSIRSSSSSRQPGNSSKAPAQHRRKASSSRKKANPSPPAPPTPPAPPAPPSPIQDSSPNKEEGADGSTSLDQNPSASDFRFHRPKSDFPVVESEGGNKAFLCDAPGCGKTFKRSEHLRRHQRSLHVNTRPYECQIEGCTKRFNRSDNLIQHQRTHELQDTASGKGSGRSRKASGTGRVESSRQAKPNPKGRNKNADVPQEEKGVRYKWIPDPRDSTKFIQDFTKSARPKVFGGKVYTGRNQVIGGVPSDRHLEVFYQKQHPEPFPPQPNFLMSGSADQVDERTPMDDRGEAGRSRTPKSSRPEPSVLQSSPAVIGQKRLEPNFLLPDDLEDEDEIDLELDEEINPAHFAISNGVIRVISNGELEPPPYYPSLPSVFPESEFPENEDQSELEFDGDEGVGVVENQENEGLGGEGGEEEELFESHRRIQEDASDGESDSSLAFRPWAERGNDGSPSLDDNDSNDGIQGKSFQGDGIQVTGKRKRVPSQRSISSQESERSFTRSRR